MKTKVENNYEVVLTHVELALVINALEFSARDEAGHSQAPGLIRKEELPEWILAQELRGGQ